MARILAKMACIYKFLILLKRVFKHFLHNLLLLSELVKYAGGIPFTIFVLPHIE